MSNDPSQATFNTARVYRFRDLVAFDCGVGDTCYIERVLARRLGQALIDCAEDIDSEPRFSCSTFETREMDDDQR